MAPLSSLFTLAALTCSCLAAARRAPAYQHEALDIPKPKFKPKRQYGPQRVPASLTQEGILTLITPSPGASPVQVTKQSQLVTTYPPQMTLCELPPLAFFHVTVPPSSVPTTAPYQNYSISTPPGNGTCSTSFDTTVTMVCATVLSDLTTTYTVSRCAQDITFSTRYSYVLAHPTPTPDVNSTANATVSSGAIASITPAPTVQTLTTYYLAPWQELTRAGPPGDVDLKVCATYENGTEECIRQYEVWKTTLLTTNATTTTSFNFTTTINGPSQVIVETFVANITEYLTTFSMSTTMELFYETEIESTETSTRVVSTGSTVYETQTVEQVSPHVTSTITTRITSTITAGTKTVTLTPLPTPTPPIVTLPTTTPGVDFASMLGIGH
nr:hypothetical protein B0A51_00020 [Rachicladosporium sp. CCFEE 5018]